MMFSKHRYVLMIVFVLVVLFSIWRVHAQQQTDLILVDFKLNNEVGPIVEVSQGLDVEVYWKIEYQGNEDLNSFFVKLYVDNYLEKSWQIISWYQTDYKTKSSDDYPPTYTISTYGYDIGEHEVKLVVDDNNDIAEANENNNEETIVMNIKSGTTQCTGSVFLSLTPESVSPGADVTPTANGLSNCDGKIVYFRKDSCSGAVVSSCPVSLGACSGAAFQAPQTPGSYDYYACIDKDGDEDYADAGEKDHKTLTVTSSTDYGNCYTPFESYQCLDRNTQQCTGTFIKGYCPGSVNIQCCVPNCQSGERCEPQGPCPAGSSERVCAVDESTQGICCKTGTESTCPPDEECVAPPCGIVGSSQEDCTTNTGGPGVCCKKTTATIQECLTKTTCEVCVADHMCRWCSSPTDIEIGFCIQKDEDCPVSGFFKLSQCSLTGLPTEECHEHCAKMSGYTTMYYDVCSKDLNYFSLSGSYCGKHGFNCFCFQSSEYPSTSFGMTDMECSNACTRRGAIFGICAPFINLRGPENAICPEGRKCYCFGTSLLQILGTFTQRQTSYTGTFSYPGTCPPISTSLWQDPEALPEQAIKSKNRNQLDCTNISKLEISNMALSPNLVQTGKQLRINGFVTGSSRSCEGLQYTFRDYKVLDCEDKSDSLTKKIKCQDCPDGYDELVCENEVKIRKASNILGVTGAAIGFGICVFLGPGCIPAVMQGFMMGHGLGLFIEGSCIDPYDKGCQVDVNKMIAGAVEVYVGWEMGTWQEAIESATKVSRAEAMNILTESGTNGATNVAAGVTDGSGVSYVDLLNGAENGGGTEKLLETVKNRGGDVKAAEEAIKKSRDQAKAIQEAMKKLRGFSYYFTMIRDQVSVSQPRKPKPCFSVCGRDYETRCSYAATGVGCVIHDDKDCTYPCSEASCGALNNENVKINIIDTNGNIVKTYSTQTDSNGMFDITLQAPSESEYIAEVVVEHTNPDGKIVSIHETLQFETYSIKPFDLRSTPTSFTALAGNEAEYTITIENPNKVDLELLVSINAPNNWVVDAPNTVEVDAGQTKNFDVKVTSPDDASEQSYDIDITVSSILYPLSSSVNIKYIIAEHSSPSITISPETVTALPGERREFVVSVKNNDPADFEPSTLQIDAEAPYGWKAELSKRSMRLNAQETYDLRLNVMSNNTPDESNKVYVTVTMNELTNEKVIEYIITFCGDHVCQVGEEVGTNCIEDCYDEHFSCSGRCEKEEDDGIKFSARVTGIDFIAPTFLVCDRSASIEACKNDYGAGNCGVGHDCICGSVDNNPVKSCSVKCVDSKGAYYMVIIGIKGTEMVEIRSANYSYQCPQVNLAELMEKRNDLERAMEIFDEWASYLETLLPSPEYQPCYDAYKLVTINIKEFLAYLDDVIAHPSKSNTAEARTRINALTRENERLINDNCYGVSGMLDLELVPPTETEKEGTAVVLVTMKNTADVDYYAYTECSFSDGTEQIVKGDCVLIPGHSSFSYEPDVFTTSVDIVGNWKVKCSVYGSLEETCSIASPHSIKEYDFEVYTKDIYVQNVYGSCNEIVECNVITSREADCVGCRFNNNECRLTKREGTTATFECEKLVGSYDLEGYVFDTPDCVGIEPLQKTVTMMCPGCGDTMLSEGEDCDPPGANEQCEERWNCKDRLYGTAIGVCNPLCECEYEFTYACIPPYCGAECSVDQDCDDGNPITNDVCLSDCTCVHY